MLFGISESSRFEQSKVEFETNLHDGVDGDSDDSVDETEDNSKISKKNLVNRLHKTHKLTTKVFEALRFVCGR